MELIITFFIVLFFIKSICELHDHCTKEQRVTLYTWLSIVFGAVLIILIFGLLLFK